MIIIDIQYVKLIFSGNCCKHHERCHPDRTVRLTWTPSTSPCVTAYLIYRNGKLIGKVGAQGPFVFKDHVRPKGKRYKYQVTAVDESDPVCVIVKVSNEKKH